jgi:hypothetical protein
MKTLTDSPVIWPSAGRSLSILIAVIAVLWLWLQLPGWYRSGHSATEAGQWLSELVYNDWTALALILGGNVIVARGATAPMWRLGHSIELQGMRGAFVFVLSLLFHLVVGGVGVALVVLGSTDGIATA